MISLELLTYIKERIAAGKSADSIKAELLAGGQWAEGDIDNAFAMIEGRPINIAAAPTAMAAPTPMPASSPATTAAPAPTTPPGMPGTAAVPAVSKAVENKVWKGIRLTNKGSLVPYLALVFGVDLIIIITNPSLTSYWLAMLGVFAGFLVFFCIENLWLAKKFSQSSSPVDGVLATVIGLRNAVVLANFIPVVQILGIVALSAAGIPFLILYLILVIVRFRISDPL